MDKGNPNDIGAVMTPNGWVVCGKGGTGTTSVTDLFGAPYNLGDATQMDIAAALTEAQAEIARLREALIAVKHGGSLTYAKMTARAALEAKNG